MKPIIEVNNFEEELKKVVGVIYAIPSFAVENILNNNKFYFIKYLPHVPSKRSKIKLKEGINIYFYESKANKEIVGEAIISRFEFLKKNELSNEVISNLMISEKELELYSEAREDKPALIIKLTSVKKYKNPIVLDFVINMGGLLVTNENKNLIIRRDSK